MHFTEPYLLPKVNTVGVALNIYICGERYHMLVMGLCVYRIFDVLRY